MCVELLKQNEAKESLKELSRTSAEDTNDDDDDSFEAKEKRIRGEGGLRS